MMISFGHSTQCAARYCKTLSRLRRRPYRTTQPNSSVVRKPDGIKPEVEIYNNGQMDDLHALIEKGVFTKPYWVSFVMNMHRNASGFQSYSPKHIIHLKDLLPSESLFTVLGVGYPTQFEATTQSILLGGHVRVGFEDNIFIDKDKLAKSNAELVARIVRIARELGREIASPVEARELLGIPAMSA